MNYCMINCTSCGQPRTKDTHVKDSGKCIHCERKYFREHNKQRRYDPATRDNVLKIDREYQQRDRLDNPEKHKARVDDWKAKNKDRFKATNSLRQKRYRLKHIVQVRTWKIRYQNKRYREMGTVPLNEAFTGCQGHHVDKDHVIYIPKELHKAVWHNHKKPETLETLNIAAFTFMEANVL